MQQVLLSTQAPLHTVCWISDSIAIAGGGAHWQETVLYRTVDAGLSWQPVHWDVYKPGGINEIIAYDNNKLLAVGMGGVCYTSTDSGVHWQFRQLGDYASYFGAAYLQNKFVFGTREGRLYSANNQLELLHSNLFSNSFNHLCVMPNGNILATGNSKILSSADTGFSWQYTNAMDDYFMDVSANTQNTAVAIGLNGSIIFKQASDSNWINIRKPNTLLGAIFYLNAITASKDANIFYAVGDKGIILRINLQQQIFTIINKGISTDLLDISCNRSNQLLLSGNNGIIYSIQP